MVGIAIAISSLKYGIGSLSDPGPGFITFFPGVILSLLSAILFISSMRDHGDRHELRELWEGFEVRKVAYAATLLVIYVIALRPVGFLISTYFLMCLLFRLKASYPLKRVLIMSVLATAGSYIIFVLLLQAQLPKGILRGIF